MGIVPPFFEGGTVELLVNIKPNKKTLNIVCFEDALRTKINARELKL